METSYLELKQKEVVNLCDGKRLGRVCDVVFTFPEGKVQGIVVPGSKRLFFGKGDLFIDLRNVKKVGVDTILVEMRSPAKPEKPASCGDKYHRDDRRDLDEYE